MSETLLQMEELPSEPLQLRCNVISIFAKYSGVTLARKLEHVCHKRRADFAERPIPKWTYGSSELFITDGPEKHAHCARNAYNDNVLIVLAKLKSKMLIDTGSTVLESPSTGLFQDWTTQLESNLSFAKKVLEEKESSTKGIFQCPHCKS